MCKKCSFVQSMPVPCSQELADYYESKYRLGRRYGADVADTTNFPYDNLFYFNRGESIAELVSKYIEPNSGNSKLRVLDIGTGFGHILHSMGKRFPNSEKYAIEISDICIEHLKSLGVHVFTEPAEKILPKLKQKFDIIILSHLFEHLVNPLEFLSLLSSNLSPTGLLYIEVPNIPVESLEKYPDHKWAPRVDEPHISFFSQKTLVTILEKVNFEVLFCDTAGYKYKYVSGFRFYLPKLQASFLNLMPRWLFSFLRNNRFTSPLRIGKREKPFYEYGGFRIWVRGISKLNSQ